MVAWLSADAAELRKHANVALAKAYTCVLEPGDVLYIPPGWWHHIEATAANISVLAPFDMSVEEQRAMSRPWIEATWGVDQGLTSILSSATASII